MLKTGSSLEPMTFLATGSHLWVDLQVSVWVCVRAIPSTRPGEGVRSPGAVVGASCELSDVGAENRAQILSKSSKCSNC